MRAGRGTARGRGAVRFALLAALLVAACEPSGPGHLTATVRAPGPTGALVIELTGTGVTGFSGVGDVRTFSVPAAAGAAVQRVVVVSAAGTDVRFRVEVEDVGAPAPVATVVAAVDMENLPVPSLAGYQVRVAR